MHALLLEHCLPRPADRTDRFRRRRARCLKQRVSIDALLLRLNAQQRGTGTGTGATRAQTHARARAPPPPKTRHSTTGTPLSIPGSSGIMLVRGPDYINVTTGEGSGQLPIPADAKARACGFMCAAVWFF